MFSDVLKANLPRLETPLFSYRTRNLNIARIRRDGWLSVLLGLSSGVGLSALLNTARWYISLGDIFSLLLLGVFLLLLASDFAYAFTALAAGRKLSLQRERLDQLRLTELSSDAIVASEFAAWQLCVWRLMALECSSRVALVTLLSLELVRYESFFFEDFRVLESIVVSSPILLLFTLEPLWRMRALGSVALSSGFQSGSVVLAGLLAGITALALHVLFVGILYAVNFFLTSLLRSLDLYIYDEPALRFGSMVLMLLAVRFSFRLISKVALRSTARALSCAE
ncbi:MAG: hypothetical protein RML95_12255 [Anaerolineae bacterium]|nr:hypothetical protein [Anaerolineae bacterium]